MTANNEQAAGDMLAAALDHAQRGWHVIPLHDMSAGVCSCGDGATCLTPGKHPRITKWQHRASTDRATLAEWGGAGRRRTSASPPAPAQG